MHRTAFTRGAADGSLLFNPFDMQMKNVANTGVLQWGDKLLALYEVRHSSLLLQAHSPMHDHMSCATLARVCAASQAIACRTTPCYTEVLSSCWCRLALTWRCVDCSCCCAVQSNLPYELDPSSLNTFGECDMHGQLQTPVLAAHYRVMPGRQQLQQQQQLQAPTNGNGKPASNGNGISSSGNGSNGSNGVTQQQQQQVYSAGSTDGRAFVGFSFNTSFGSGGAEMIFYEFAGQCNIACPAGWFVHIVDTRSPLSGFEAGCL